MSGALDSIANATGLSKLGGGAWMGQSNYTFDPYQVDASSFNDPNFAANYAQMQQALANYQQQQATAGTNQSGLIAALQAQMAGQQPSVAQNQLAQTTAANNQAALAQAASQASVNPAEAARQAQYAAASNNQNAAAQAATLRAQEQLGGEQTLGNVLAQQSGQAQQGALTQQQLQAQTSQQQVANQMARQQLQAQDYNVAEGANMGQAQQNAAIQGNVVGGILSGGAAGAAKALMKEGGPVPWRPSFAHAITRRFPALRATDRPRLPIHAANSLRFVAPLHLAYGGGVGPAAQYVPAPSVQVQPPNFTPLMVALAQRAMRPATPGTFPSGGDATSAGSQAQDAAGLTGTEYDFGATAGDSPTNFVSGFAGGGTIRVLASHGGVTPGHGAPKADDVPAMLSSGEVVENNDAVDYFDRHMGRGFLAKLNEVGKLGQALEHHHGIAVEPADLIRVLSARNRNARVPTHFVLGGGVGSRASSDGSANGATWPWDTSTGNRERDLVPDSSNHLEDWDNPSDGEASANAPEPAAADDASPDQPTVSLDAQGGESASEDKSGAMLAGNPSHAAGGGWKVGSAPGRHAAETSPPATSESDPPAFRAGQVLADSRGPARATRLGEFRVPHVCRLRWKHYRGHRQEADSRDRENPPVLREGDRPQGDASRDSSGNRQRETRPQGTGAEQGFG